MRDQIAGAIAEAILATNPPPSNEQETCFRVIDPLLRSMGYGYQDIKVQDRDKAREKPDYTILPDAPDQTWFLEAKAWSVPLVDDHAIQAVNYANTQGKRWVVLSNGLDWRLYDNHILGTVEAKLACTSKLGEEAFSGFLEALSKPSIQQKKLEDFVRNERLYTCLSSQITRPDSDVIKAIVKALKATPGLSSVSAADVVGFWRDYAPSSTATILPASPSISPVREQPEFEDPGEQAANVRQDGTFALGSLDSEAITGMKIKALILPSGQAKVVSKWNQLIVQVALFALEEGSMPASPLFMSERAKSPLVAKADSTESGRMREPIRLPAPHADWLVEGHFSAFHLQRASATLLRASGIDPATFQIVIESAQSQ